MERDGETGMIELKQTGLYDQTINYLVLDIGNTKGMWTPADAKPLVKDGYVDNPTGDFSYISVVGILLYLAGHLSPGIAYAVNCAASYMFSPKKIKLVIKRIGQYLKAKRDRGLVLNAYPELKIDCYPGADFSANNPACANRITRYAITVVD